MTQEPTVWDYVKAKLMPWKGEAPTIPDSSDEPIPPVATSTSHRPDRTALKPFPFLTLGALIWALIGQSFLQPSPGSPRGWMVGAVCYFIGGLWLVAAIWRKEWRLAARRQSGNQNDPETVYLPALIVGLLLTALAFWLLGENQFTKVNVFLWITGLLALLIALWLPGSPINWREGWKRVKTLGKQNSWQVSFKLSGWLLVCILAIGLIIFFRFYQLASVPPEMTSDHAEKLLDVWDILHGKTSIFFPRNSGREPFQFYLTALMIKLFHTGYSFMSLKLGTALAGLFMLAYLYAFGKEVGNKRVGLFAMLLAGIGYWPNVITRIALRFSLLPLFTAPVFFHLFRGLRTRNRNHLLLAGLFLGLGLHGYSPFRIVPIMVLVVFVLYMIHPQSRGARQQTLWGLLVLILISVVVFLPLLRFISDPSMPANRDIFFGRSLSRLSDLEQPLPGNPVTIFLDNIWKASMMFFWKNGTVWSVSVPDHPALDIVTAALYFIGVIGLLVRYFRKPHWMDITLLASIPVLLLASALSLAFPDENPILNRTAGAIIPVFTIAALALDGIMTALQRWRPRRGIWVAWGVAVVLIFVSALQNYNLVFSQYLALYRSVSLNTSEIGSVIHDFAESIGSYDTAWVVPYPYWVDTRLVGMNADQPIRDYAINADRIQETLNINGNKLFILHPEDDYALQVLRDLYPQGSLQRYTSKKYIDKDFLIYFVPAAGQDSATGQTPDEPMIIEEPMEEEP